MVKVSVIVPVYNVGLYLEECLRSAMAQTLQDIEIICVNDGSTDDSEAILRRLNEEDGRIRILSQENAGLSVTRNAGLHEAIGEYVAFLDSDDLLALYALESLYSEAKKYNLDQLFYGGESFFDSVELSSEQAKYSEYYHYKQGYDQVSSGQILFRQLRENRDFKPSVPMQLFRRGFLTEHQLFFYPGILHEDNLFTAQCLMLAKKAKVFDEPLYQRRIRPDSIVTMKNYWDHAYGYLTGVREIGKSIAAFGVQGSAFASFLEYRTIMAQMAERALQNLSEEELRDCFATLPIEEQAEFSLIVELVRREIKAKHITNLVKNSRRYRLGSAMATGFSSPIEFLKLPIRLWKVLRKE